MKLPTVCAASLAALATIVACNGLPGDDLSDGMLTLPRVLREVSGITAATANTVACVQDEHGVLFLVDLTGKADVRSLPFGERGDYESVARVDDTWWVLRADGLLLRVVTRDGALAIAGTTRLPGEHREWEALCFDRERKRLLAMPKVGAGADKDARDARPIVAVDPATGVVDAAPLLVLHRKGLIEQAEARGIALPTRTTPKGKERVTLELACSELAAVPGSGDLLVLCGTDHLLMRVDREGRLLASAVLDPARLPQAEGLTFLDDGRLLVASEGRGGAARLVVVPVPAP
jgi:hypothetical protein